MSNRGGGLIINNILCTLETQGVFDLLGQEKTLRFLHEIREIGAYYDCNADEILDEVGEKLKLCWKCWNYVDNLEDGVCSACSESLQ